MTGRAIRVRPYAPGDEHQLIAMIVHIQTEEFGIPITAEDQPDLMDIPGVYQQRCGNFWVAETDGRIVGTIALLDIGGGQGALRKLFVRAQYRGAGTGTAATLLNTLMAWAGRSGFQGICLGTTSKFIAAHRFYEKNGFSKIPKADLPASFPVMAVDSHFYRINV